MAKKTLPKAIRPGVVRGGTSDPDPRISEPVPEGASHSAARQASSISAVDVTEIAAGDRKTRARKLVERFSLWSGVAGLLPVPVVDLAVVGGVQLQMLRRLSQIFDIPFSKNRGKAIMASFAGTIIPASTGLGVASMIKAVPVAGTAIGALTTPALSVGATYVIGMAFIEHFASGGTLLDFEPPDYREFIKTNMGKTT
ncbi:MAG: YcjF family protein [Pseudolabrys sp.]